MSRPVVSVVPDELYNVIAGAASQDPAQVSACAARLKQMLDMHSTFDCLNAIATQRNVPLVIRQQSIIQFKNYGLTHWKAKRLISDEQRVNIRARSLSLLEESDDVIADCNKQIIARIARYDFPGSWFVSVDHLCGTDLITILLSSIDEALKSFVGSGGNDPRATLVLRRSFEVLNAILKEFASIRMPNGVNVMKKLVENLHPTLQGYYSTLSNNFATLIDPSSISSHPTADAIFLAHLAYKCMSKMAVWTWNRLGLNSCKELRPWVEDFFESSAVQLKTLSELRINIFLALGPSQNQRPSDQIAARSLDYLTRHTRQFGKLFRRMQQLYCSKFVALNKCSDLVLYYWSKVVQATNGPSEIIADSQWAVFPVRFIVQAMVIFKESLGQWSLTKQGPDGSATFSKEFVEEAVKLLVTRFIPLNPKDLDSWLADPEEWVNIEDKENEQWEYELRPCGERVLMALANQYEGYVVPLLQATFNQIIGTSTVDLDSIVQKEALYCAIGRCAIRLRNVIPFQQWVAQNLAAEARDSNPNFPIIKRRIAWVLGKWVSDECAPPNEDIWNILIHLLRDRGPGTDPVVRFTAAGALRECVDCLQFDEDVFAPHLPAAISQLMDLSAEADTSEAKTRVTESLNVVIERMGQRTTITKLAELNPIVVPVLQEASQMSRAQLDEAGLKLWKTVLQNAATLESISSPVAIALLSENLDLLGSVTAVVHSYFVLDAVTVLQAYGMPLLSAFTRAIGQAVQTNQKDMVLALQLLVQLAPAQLWAEPMHASGLFAVLMKTILDDDAITTLLTEHVCLFARMALNDAVVLSQLVSAAAPTVNKLESELWNELLNQWWRRFDNMSEPRYRKLTAMGIACLVATGRAEVLERLTGEIFNLWLDVFGEMKEALVEISGEESQSTLSPLVTFWRDNGSVLPGSLDHLEGTPEYERWREIYGHDPVETEKLTTFVAQRLQRAHEIYGPTLEERYLRDADPGVLKQLNEELIS
ncbi:ARM repeat-containing protein [Phellopilus nigrolimitatus]|nr:ARM repeat-containing protein [Phellopilus nigrolimitatus]